MCRHLRDPSVESQALEHHQNTEACRAFLRLPCRSRGPLPRPHRATWEQHSYIYVNIFIYLNLIGFTTNPKLSQTKATGAEPMLFSADSSGPTQCLTHSRCPINRGLMFPENLSLSQRQISPAGRGEGRQKA